jgi:hypothetical protein
MIYDLLRRQLSLVDAAICLRKVYTAFVCALPFITMRSRFTDLYTRRHDFHAAAVCGEMPPTRRFASADDLFTTMRRTMRR